jgi:hypothetical protein
LKLTNRKVTADLIQTVTVTCASKEFCQKQNTIIITIAGTAI